jgi:hypothetical protein
MPRVGNEPATPVFERFRALDCEGTVIGYLRYYILLFNNTAFTISFLTALKTILVYDAV